MSQQEERRHTEDEHQSTPLFDERWPPYEESVRESMSISSSASEFGPPPEEPPPPKPIQTREAVGSCVLFQTAFLPVLNVLITAVLLGVLVLIYIRADGQPIDYKIANLPVPVLLALIMTLAVLFISGGVAYAISEYKWVHFERNTSALTLLDAYDACSRGIGAAIRALPFLRFDIIIISAMIIYLGLIGMGPAAQGVLHVGTSEQCVRDDNNTRLYGNHYDIQDFSTYVPGTYDPLTIKGIQKDYVMDYAWRQRRLNYRLQGNSYCPQNALNCTYFVPYAVPHMEYDCQPGSPNTTQIVDVHANNVTTLTDYWNKNYMMDVPAFYYAGSMLGRTFYDLNNHTTSQASGSNTTYNPQVRKMFGDQTFVLVTYGDSLSPPSDETDVHVRECTLRPYMNHTYFAVRGSELLHSVDYTVPVPIDYDQIGNTSNWCSHGFGDDLESNYTLINMYAFQLSLLKTLILDGLGANSDFTYIFGADQMTVDQYLQDTFKYIGLAAITLLPDNMVFSPGLVCTTVGPHYQLNPSAYFAVALVLSAPLVWWVVTWILCLYQINGVSRGHSLVALLISGLTPAVREQLQGLSHADQFTMAATACNVQVRFGERKTPDGRTGHAIFGLPEEVNPVGARRMSI